MEIQGQPKKAFLIVLPAILLAILVGLSYAFYFRHLTPCDEIFGIHATYMALLAFTYGVPLMLLLISSPNLFTAYKVFKHGYYPPLDTVTFRTTVAKKGGFAYMRGALLLLLPLVVIIALGFGHHTYQTLAGDRSYSEMLVTLNENCAKGL